VLAEMDNGWITVDQLPDGTHPSDDGFKKMARQFYDGINKAYQAGFLAPPSYAGFDDSVSVATATCDKKLGSAFGDKRSGMEILKALSSVIVDDGKYIHKSESGGIILQGTFKGDFSMDFAQLVNFGNGRGGENEEFVYKDSTGMWMQVNKGNGVFEPKVKIDPKHNCPTAGIRWGDVNNDGLDDFICITTWASIEVSINRGGNPPTFENLGEYRKGVNGKGREHVRLGDIDGDGRLDYCIMDGNNALTCYRNGGIGDRPSYWQDFGVIHAGEGRQNAGIMLVDVNGDFRSDWLYMDENGAVTTHINQRPAGKTLKPHWLDSGVTHLGVRMPDRVGIRFGKVYGSGRRDYLHIRRAFDGDTAKYEVHAWKNLGSGGTYQKGDGIFFCDMDGSGNDDYIFVDSKGVLTIFRNPNPPGIVTYGWDEHRNVLNTNANRKAVQFGDWDGDGKCDVIVTDRKNGGADVYFTRWDSAAKKFSFSAKTRVASSGQSIGPNCAEGWGVGFRDLGVRYADIE